MTEEVHEFGDSVLKRVRKARARQVNCWSKFDQATG